MLSGKFNFENGQKTFDLFAYDETTALVHVTNCHIQLSYVNEQGEIVQLRKEIKQNPLIINVGSKLITSSITDEYGGGFLESANGQLGNNFVAKSLAHVDFTNTATMTKLQTRTFTDSGGVEHVAVLLPIIL